MKRKAGAVSTTTTTAAALDAEWAKLERDAQELEQRKRKLLRQQILLELEEEQQRKQCEKKTATPEPSEPPPQLQASDIPLPLMASVRTGDAQLARLNRKLNARERMQLNEELEISHDFRFTRGFGYPESETFNIPIIKNLLARYIPTDPVRRLGLVVVDPFSRNSTWGTEGHTNDLNPNTSASYHMDAVDFLKLLLHRGVRADVVLFDPPYSARQISECYQGVGRKVHKTDTQLSRLYAECKDVAVQLLKAGGVAISFGWNSGGFGKGRHCYVTEILMVYHGGSRYDTLVTVEKKHWDSS